MGGFGALSIGLRHPKTFGFIIGLSPTDLEIAVQKQPRRKLYTDVFGIPPDLDLVRRVNPYSLIRRGLGKSQRILLAYGSAEPKKFLAGAKRLIRAMTRRKLTIAVRVVTGGRHGWKTTWTADLHRWWIARLGRWLSSSPLAGPEMKPSPMPARQPRRGLGSRASGASR